MEQNGRTDFQSTTAGSGPFKDPGTASIADSVARGRDAIGDAAQEALNAATSDVQSLRNDINNLKDTLAKFLSQAGNEAAKSARDVGATVASQVSDAASDLANKGATMASGASDQAKNFAAELEAMARRNPIGTLASAVLVGVLIGVVGRRR
jgi:ElaB/YqjD/DUF883 family membrane-anchored ribosome-binding protein